MRVCPGASWPCSVEQADFQRDASSRAPGPIIKALLLCRARIVALPRMGGVGKISSSHKLHNHPRFWNRSRVGVTELRKYARGEGVISCHLHKYGVYVTCLIPRTGRGSEERCYIPVVRCALRTRTAFVAGVAAATGTHIRYYSFQHEMIDVNFLDGRTRCEKATAPKQQHHQKKNPTRLHEQSRVVGE